ncbi:GNAT family N-acetyltransferase [Trinickia sp. LjRoot230]|uniref:GNAT family N-acetyltransferase n=1 Tax=Trinickia sp. LjRoot230 TaxID=3342288 RepID=UPI003ECE0802
MLPFRAPQLIETDELFLRPPTPDDAQALFDEMFSDVETMRFLPFPRHAELSDTLEYIEESKQGWESGTMLRWVLADKATGKLAGLFQLEPRPPRAEIGLITSRVGGTRRRRAWVKMLRRMLKWLIAQPSIYRVTACCATDGPAQSFMEKLGFTLEAKLTNYESRPNIGLIAGDSYLYAMTRTIRLPKPTPATTWLAAEEGQQASR